MNILIISATVPLYTEALARSLSADTSFQVATQTFQTLSYTTSSIKPDLVLLTLGQSVSDLHRTLRTVQRHLPDVPIIVVLPELRKELISTALSAGARGIITGDEELCDVIQDLHHVQRGKCVLPFKTAGWLTPGRPTVGSNGTMVLTQREVEVLDQLAIGRDDLATARALHISRHTVRTHVRNILQKLGVHSRMAAVLRAMDQGLIRLPALQDRSRDRPETGTEPEQPGRKSRHSLSVWKRG